MGIKIIDKIANIEIKLNPVATDKIHTFEISKEYLHTFNLLCFIFSLIDFEYLQIIFPIVSYIISVYKQIY